MAITVSLLMLPPVLQAEDFTTLEGDHYSNATIKKVDPDGLLIAYPDGVVKLKFKKLPPAIGVKYGYNPSAEAEYLAREQLNQLAAYDKAVLTKEHAQHNCIKKDVLTPPSQTNISPKSTTFFSSLTDRIKSGINRSVAWAFPTPTPAPTPPPPPTPEEQIQALTKGSVVDASRLASLCEAYPSQAKAILQNSRIKVSGTIHRLAVLGVNSADLEVDLQGTPNRDIVFATDYERYNSEFTGTGGYGYKIVKTNNRLLLYHLGDSYNCTAFERILYTIGDKVTLEGLIDYIDNNGAFKIHWAKGIE